MTFIVFGLKVTLEDELKYNKDELIKLNDVNIEFLGEKKIAPSNLLIIAAYKLKNYCEKEQIPNYVLDYCHEKLKHIGKVTNTEYIEVTNDNDW